MDASPYPRFYSPPEFAQLAGMSVKHAQRAAHNYPIPWEPNYFPTGWGSFKYGRDYIIFEEKDAPELSKLFRREIWLRPEAYQVVEMEIRG